MREVGALIAEVLTNIANEDAIAAVRQKVEALTGRFPLYAWKLDTGAGVECRCTSSSTPAASAISASAPTSATWCTRLAPSTGPTSTPWSAARPTCARSPGCRRTFTTAVYARSDHSALDHVAFPLFLRGLSPDLVHIPLNRVPLLMIRPYVVTIHDMANLFFEEDTSNFRMQLRRFRFRPRTARARRA